MDTEQAPQLSTYVESLIFSAPGPISSDTLQKVLSQTFDTKISSEDLQLSIDALEQKYGSDGYSFELVEIDGGYTFRTKGAYFPVISTFLKLENPKRLSRAALETLSIIAYRQPVTKPELEAVRGVSCDYTIQKLLEKELITILGRKDAPGKPLLYGTSEKFMNHFGLGSIEDLPKLREIHLPDNQIGNPEEVEFNEEIQNQSVQHGEEE